MEYNVCDGCGKPIQDGHVIDFGGPLQHMCSDCMNKYYSEEDQADMYDDGEQYWTEFDGDGFSEIHFELAAIEALEESGDDRDEIAGKLILMEQQERGPYLEYRTKGGVSLRAHIFYEFSEEGEGPVMLIML